MVERSEYLEQLKQWKDEQVIKVVTGIRRCGKSTLLKQYQQWLKASGIPDAQIISVNWSMGSPPIFIWMRSRKCLPLKRSWTVSM